MYDNPVMKWSFDGKLAKGIWLHLFISALKINLKNT